MADTIRTQTDLLTNLFEDGQAPQSISPQDMRDLIVSTFGVFATTVAGTSRTLALTDIAICLEFTSSTAVTLTIPTNASVPIPVGSVIEGLQYGTGQLTIVAASGVTLRPQSPVTTRAQYSPFSLRQRTANEWVASGDLT